MSDQGSQGGARCWPKTKFVGFLAVFLAALGPARTESAVANGDTRTIYLHHIHTGENIAVTFKRDGRYDPAALQRLNYFLRDWRNNDEIAMDPRLFDVVWETYRESGSRYPIQVVSAYRSPKTNAMLRRRTVGVAEHSQHMLGKAMDMHYVDVPMWKIREIGMRLERGGVGYYPTSGIPFVHLDVGNVRYWPRMSYAQLAHLFPDGKAVFKAADGRVLPRYAEARAEVNDKTMRGGENRFAENAPVSPLSRIASAFTLGRQTPVTRAAASERATPVRAALAPIDPTRLTLRLSRAEPAEPEIAAASGMSAKTVAVATEPKVAPVEEWLAPIPPRRPLGLLAEDAGPIPRPPTRPVQLASLEQTLSDGDDDRDDAGFDAAIASAANFEEVAPLPPIRPSHLSPPRRSSKTAALARGARVGVARTTTLRKDLDIVAMVFAPHPFCPTHFSLKLSEPSTHAFVGRAVQPLNLASSD